MDEFARALPLILIHEGGFSNHPKDPGGATMKGVTQRVYDDYRRGRSLPPQSVRSISETEISAVYRERYWELIKGDLLPSGVGYVVFDGAVNSGPGQSGKWLQRALGTAYTGPVDGLIGPGTLAAVARHPAPARLIDDICNQRLAFLKSLKTWPTFGKGWARRVGDVRAQGKIWAVGIKAAGYAEDVSQPMATDVGQKALSQDAVAAPPVAPGNTIASGGTATAIISQALGQLQPLQAVPSIQNIIMWLTVISVVLALGGLAYGFWARRRKAKIEAATA